MDLRNRSVVLQVRTMDLSFVQTSIDHDVRMMDFAHD